MEVLLWSLRFGRGMGNECTILWLSIVAGVCACTMRVEGLACVTRLYYGCLGLNKQLSAAPAIELYLLDLLHLVVRNRILLHRSLTPLEVRQDFSNIKFHLPTSDVPSYNPALRGL